MRKLLLLICALLTSVSGAWAFEVTIANDPSRQLPSAAFGSFNGQVFTTSAGSGLAGVTLTAETGLTIGEQMVTGSYYGYSFKFVTSAASTPYSVTLSAPDGYKITGYSLKCSANSKNNCHTLTSEDGTSTVEVSSPPYNSPAGSKEFNVTGLSAQTTYFTISTAYGGNTLYIPYFTIFLEALDPVNITYNMMYNGSSVATFAAPGSKIGAVPEIPASAYRKYCTYAYYSDEECTTALTVLPSTNATVYTKVTYNPPFTVSSGFEGATWYYLYFNRDNGPKYWQMNPNSTPYPDQTSKPSTVSEAVWAFTGDPYNGIKVMNARAGEKYYLKRTGTSNGSAITMQSGGTTWNLNDGDGGFFMYDNEYYPNGYTVCMHDFSTQLAVWNNFSAPNDKGSAIVVEDAAPIKVTYKLTYNGNEISSYTKDLYELVGATAAAPFDWVLPDYCSLGSCSPATITSETTEVTIPLNWNGPFDISSDYASAVWYYMKSNNAWVVYDSSDETKLPVVSTIDEAKDYGNGALWAFIGNPCDGVQVVNKEKGSGYYIDVNNNVVMVPSGYTVTQITDEESNGFSLSNTGYSFGSNSEKFILIGSSDSRRFLTVRSYYCQQALDNWTNYVGNSTDKLFGVRSESVTSIEGMILGSPNMTESLYNDYFATIPNSNIEQYISYNCPETGYYRIKNNSTGNYLAYGLPVAPGHSYNPALIAVSDANDFSTIIRLEQKTAGGNAVPRTYFIETQGLNVQGQTTGSQPFPVTNGDGAPFVFNSASPAGVVSITHTASHVDDNNDGSLHEASDGWTVHGVVNWSASAGASKWVVEEAETVNVSLNGPVGEYYYATLCLPFDVTLSEACAYTLTLNNTKDALTLSDATDEVPAGTPVLLRASAATITATIGSGYAATPSKGTSLTGCYASATVDAETVYTLSNGEDGIGFYQFTGSSIAPNRAYVSAETAALAARGLVLLFGETTGINGIAPTIPAGETFDLQGRRVNQAAKGLYIQGSKKVLF